MAVSAPVRSIWMVIGTIACVPFFVFGTANVVSTLAHEERTVTRVLERGVVGTLEVHLDNGSVRVIGGDDPGTIVVRAQVSEGLRQTRHDIDREGTRLVVSASCPIFLSNFCGVDYTIQVPPDLAVFVRQGNGKTSITDIRGPVDVETGNGDVGVERIEGEARLHSGNGSVSASFALSPQRVEATTGNGDVDVVVPRDGQAYDVEISTGNGSTDTLVRTAPGADRVIRGHSGNGDVTVRYPGR